MPENGWNEKPCVRGNGTCLDKLLHKNMKLATSIAPSCLPGHPRLSHVTRSYLGLWYRDKHPMNTCLSNPMYFYPGPLLGTRTGKRCKITLHSVACLFACIQSLVKDFHLEPLPFMMWLLACKEGCFKRNLFAFTNVFTHYSIVYNHVTPTVE